MCRSSLKSCRREISDLQGLVTSPPVFNYGKGVDEVQERQKRRKVATLKESCQQALSFVESYNAEVTTMSIKTKTTKEIPLLPLHILLRHHQVAQTFLMKLSKFCISWIDTVYQINFTMSWQ